MKTCLHLTTLFTSIAVVVVDSNLAREYTTKYLQTLLTLSFLSE
jgi:hypothetical protein